MNNILYTNNFKEFSLVNFAVDDSSNLYISTSNNTLLIFNTDSLIITATLTIPYLDSFPLFLSLMKDNKLILSKENKAIIYDTKVNDVIYSFDIPLAKTKEITQIKDGRVLLSSQDDIVSMDNIIYYN